MGGPTRLPAAAGIDIGGTTTSAVVIGDDGAIVAEASLPTPAREGGTAMFRTAVRVCEMAMSRGRFELTAVGVGAAGVIDPADGSILAASNSFRDWAGYPLASDLRMALHVPVVVENDVNAFIEGERRIGAARGLDDVLGMTLGTGVGGALVIGGGLHTGPNGAAGEIGHVPGFGNQRCSCGRTGHLETLASGPAIARRYLERRGSGNGAAELTAVDVAAAAREGDPAAAAVFDDAGRAVATAAVMVATLVDVTHVVVGGGVARAWDLLQPAIEAGIAAEPPVSEQPITVVASLLGVHAVAVGAAFLADRGVCT
ncbi:ROK family protein [Phytoactinopolyspora limicola]|uniref:ROK family protein n=1 Tax=Phytoactinopolyspora limicola TaxID=2715536 RepID=UPI001A9C5778|nr:ROK family protein [Phytoactinopolyspora limicola]